VQVEIAQNDVKKKDGQERKDGDDRPAKDVDQ
jgi:hypothetical protein